MKIQFYKNGHLVTGKLLNCSTEGPNDYNIICFVLLDKKYRTDGYAITQTNQSNITIID